MAVVVLPEFTPEGNLPVGVHLAGWQQFQQKFGTLTPRRVWLLGQLRTLMRLAAETCMLQRVFVWGSFVTTKATPRDLDVLLVMSGDFETERLSRHAQAVFESTRAKLLFESDIFWTRVSIGEETLNLWLETYQTSRNFMRRSIVELELE
jgi:Family of unknown function (DUF6932)